MMGGRCGDCAANTREADAVADDGQELAQAQRTHWQNTYAAHHGMYGEQPSDPAVHAAAVFRAAGAKDVLELGAGHGRDALYFAPEGFTVQAADFSPVGLEQLQETARSQGLDQRVATVVHDVREPLPLSDASTGAVFAHMLLCMALSTEEIHDRGQHRRAEVRRLVPGLSLGRPWAVPGPSKARRGRPTTTGSDSQASAVNSETPGQSRTVIRVSPQGWRSGKMGCICPLPDFKLPDGFSWLSSFTPCARRAKRTATR